MMQKLPKKIIEPTLSQKKDVVLWDFEIRGFMCKLLRTFIKLEIFKKVRQTKR